MTRPAPQTMPDRRLEPRVQALRPGKLYVGDRSAEVLIVDISVNGARVRLRVAARIPTSVVLVDRQTAEAHRAAVVWSRDGELGLRLTASTSLKGPVPTALKAAKAWCDEAAVPVRALDVFEI